MLSTTPLCLPSIQRRPAASVQYIVPCSVRAKIDGKHKGVVLSILSTSTITSSALGAAPRR